ncbi:hypothetical protein [Vampirovibrio chlorellavorus]|uniref:hypothetical protein n=1 Tax=Vampirovibrio chlorellavorus TaxID=758823 RepID=UPI0026EADA10|nr:hypothetical protein [Vampirovibrio chlorellavorus]
MSFTALFSLPATPIAAMSEALHGPKPGTSERESLTGLIKSELLKSGQSLQRQATRWLSATLILLGLCTLYDQGVGDGTLPGLNDLSGIREIRSAARQNSSRSLKGPAHWQSLSGGRSLLLALSPSLADWLYQLHHQRKIVYAAPAHWQSAYGQSSETPLLAAYEPWSGKLYIGADFWTLSDGEKAAILAHEYRHARQNWPKVISHRLAQWLMHGQLQYHTPLEREAFDYERQARAALGLSPLTAHLSP